MKLNFGNQIRLNRRRMNLTQEQLAESSGVSVCAVTFLENCKKKPRVGTLIKIAKAFEIDANELLKYVC